MNTLPKERKARARVRPLVPKRLRSQIYALGPMISMMELEFWIPPESRLEFGKFGQTVIVPAGSLGLGFAVPEEVDPQRWVVIQWDGMLLLWESWHDDWRPLTPLEEMALLALEQE